MSNFYGYVTISNGVRSYANIGSGGLEGLLIGNESGLTVVITLQGANTSRSLYPGMIDWFPIPNTGFNGVVQIDPTAMLSNATSWPGSYIQIDTYGIGETPKGTYPVTVNRALNIGNSVSTQMAAASSVTNDGNVAGTQFIEATPGDAASSTVSVLNNGTTTIKGDNAGVLTTLLQLVGGASPAVKIAAINLVAEALGGFKVDQNLTVIGTSSLDNGNITTNGTGIITANPYTAASGALKEYVIGNLKIVVLNANASGSNITLPVAVNFPWFYFASGSSGSSFKTGSTAINVSRITSMGADGSFNTSVSTTLGTSGFGFQTTTNCDNIANAPSFLIMIGN